MNKVAIDIGSTFFGGGHPLQQISGVGQLVSAIVSNALVIAGIILLFLLVFGGISMVVGAGQNNPEQAARGKQAATAAVIGFIIIVAAYWIIQLIELITGLDILQGGGGSGCFLAGTKVQMVDGTYKEIQEIKPGDIVYSYDLEAGVLVIDEVEKLIVHKEYQGGHLVINDRLKVTGNHNIWVANKLSWERADSLVVGDRLLDPKGKEVLITSINFVEGENTVYNLSLSGINHNYFTENILVHNALKI